MECIPFHGGPSTLWPGPPQGQRSSEPERAEVRPLLWLPPGSTTTAQPGDVSRQMESILTALGGEAVPRHPHAPLLPVVSSATNPEMVPAPGAEDHRQRPRPPRQAAWSPPAPCADFNLEIRDTNKAKIPIFHFSEILALAFGPRITKNGSSAIWTKWPGRLMRIGQGSLEKFVLQ